jgi:hypothetical protein
VVDEVSWYLSSSEREVLEGEAIGQLGDAAFVERGAAR